MSLHHMAVKVIGMNQTIKTAIILSLTFLGNTERETREERNPTPVHHTTNPPSEKKVNRESHHLSVNV